MGSCPNGPYPSQRQSVSCLYCTDPGGGDHVLGAHVQAVAVSEGVAAALSLRMRLRLAQRQHRPRDLNTADLTHTMCPEGATTCILDVTPCEERALSGCL